jgi:hypothetical protein
MTETSILPVTSDEGQPPSYDSQPPDEDGAAGANRRKLLMAGGVVGAVVIAAAAFFLLHGGGSTTPTATVVPHGTPRASAPPTKTHTTGGKVTTLPKKAKAQVGRNPFVPLFVAPSAATGTAVGSTTTVTAPTPVSTSPTAPVTTPPVAPVTTAPPSGLGSPTFLQLLSTDGAKSATFKVGYSHHRFKKYVVMAPTGSTSSGTVFDTEFALLGIQDGQATVQIGDGTPFDLSKGVVRHV